VTSETKFFAIVFEGNSNPRPPDFDQWRAQAVQWRAEAPFDCCKAAVGFFASAHSTAGATKMHLVKLREREEI